MQPTDPTPPARPRLTFRDVKTPLSFSGADLRDNIERVMQATRAHLMREREWQIGRAIKFANGGQIPPLEELPHRVQCHPDRNGTETYKLDGNAILTIKQLGSHHRFGRLSPEYIHLTAVNTHHPRYLLDPDLERQMDALRQQLLTKNVFHMELNLPSTD